MIVVSNRLYVAAGREQDFEARFVDRAGLVDSAPGFVRHEVLRPESAGAPYVVMTHWADDASFHAWTESPAFREAHARGGSSDLFIKPGALEIHTVLAGGAARDA